MPGANKSTTETPKHQVPKRAPKIVLGFLLVTNSVQRNRERERERVRGILFIEPSCGGAETLMEVEVLKWGFTVCGGNIL